MKLGEIIKNHHWLSIRETLFVIDPELLEFEKEYEQVFKTLNELKPEKTNIILILDRHWEDGKPTQHAHAYGFDPLLGKLEPTPYLALEWTNWIKWLGFEIGKDAIDEWTELQIICHSMIEMTLDGFTEEDIEQTSGKIITNIITIKTNYFNENLDNE